MGAALYIVLEKEIPGLDPFVNGKALSRAEKNLDRLAKDLKVTPLMSFFSEDPQEAMDFMESEGMDADEMPEIRPEQWFAASDGLATVQTLRNHLQSNMNAVKEAERVIGELDEFVALFTKANKVGVRWHLAVDF